MSVKKGGAITIHPPLHHTGIVRMSEDDALAKRLLGLEGDYRCHVPKCEALCIFTKAQGMKLLEDERVSALRAPAHFFAIFLALSTRGFPGRDCGVGITR